MFRTVERNGDEVIREHLEHDGCIAEVKRRLGKNRLARQQWLLDLFRNRDSPAVMLVTPIRETDKQAGVGDSLHRREKPFREAR